MILSSAEVAQKQALILRDIIVPVGKMRVTSLEAGDWDWLEIAVPEGDDC